MTPKVGQAVDSEFGGLVTAAAPPRDAFEERKRDIARRIRECPDPDSPAFRALQGEWCRFDEAAGRARSREELGQSQPRAAEGVPLAGLRPKRPPWLMVRLGPEMMRISLSAPRTSRWPSHQAIRNVTRHIHGADRRE